MKDLCVVCRRPTTWNKTEYVCPVGHCNGTALEPPKRTPQSADNHLGAVDA